MKRSDGSKAELEQGQEQPNDIVEIPDDAEIMAGMNWNAPNPFNGHREDPAYRYYYAVDRAGVGGTVAECKTLGYEVDPTQQSSAPGHVLMRIPMKLWLRRQRMEALQTEAMQGEALEPVKNAMGERAPTAVRDTEHGVRRLGGGDR